jgi:hypothetical protein
MIGVSSIVAAIIVYLCFFEDTASGPVTLFPIQYSTPPPEMQLEDSGPAPWQTHQDTGQPERGSMTRISNVREEQPKFSFGLVGAVGPLGVVDPRLSRHRGPAVSCRADFDAFALTTAPAVPHCQCGNNALPSGRDRID